MAVFKCKICGANLEISENQSVITCEYCSTQQTLPKFDDDRKITLFTRANHLRFNCEFDKAAGVYESIVTEFPDEAEAYWGLVLCKYGIEYVDDKYGSKIPTCHRTLPTSIMDDEDFTLACDYADINSKSVYRNEAKAIDAIQKKILQIAATEKPYDIFICYKETDDNTGARTEDSSIAQDIYTQLIKDGYKVFFSRVTLREVAGTEYEPYIYAALSSAKVMLAIGTRYEYYDAVWVKNEWSRFISMMGDDSTKMLIPCYRNMDAYDMPKEFKNMQALDMGEVTFFASLSTNINRLLPKVKAVVKESVAADNVTGASVDSLLKRAFMFLEDGDWNNANIYCEKILDIDPENAQAYLGELLIELKVSKFEKLSEFHTTFSDNKNYEKIMRFADSELKERVKNCNDIIARRLEVKRIKAEEDEKDAIYKSACTVLDDSYAWLGKDADIDALEEAIKEFESLEGWRDSKEKISLCKQNIEEFKEIIKEKNLEFERQAEINRQEARRYSKRKKLLFLIASIILLIAIITKSFIIPYVSYSNAVALMGESKYQEAISVFETLDGHKDSVEQIRECKYRLAIASLDEENSAQAYKYFVEIGDYKDTIEKLCPVAYSCGVNLFNKGEIVEAMGCFANARGYEDAENYLMNWNAKTISTGSSHIVGLKSDGTVVAVGQNYEDISDWSDIVAISAGAGHTVGLKSDGTVVAVGGNFSGQCNVSDWTDIVAISAGSGYTVGLKSDGRVVAVGSNSYGRCDVEDWTDIVAISAGYYHTVGLKSDGTVVAVGLNDAGQCDVDDWIDIKQPT